MEEPKSPINFNDVCMIKKEIKNSSGKIIGEILIKDNCIEIYNGYKPVLKLNDSTEINLIINKDISLIKTLYDKYTMTIGEIASLYNMKYHEMNDLIKSIPKETKMKQGRRNSSYGLQFSEERLRHMSESQKGNMPVGYIRTDEIKQKISSTLKRKYKSGELKVNNVKISNAWENGRYKNSEMGISIQGSFFSLKNNRRVRFRSLLELKYMLLLEERNDVYEYIEEPFYIKLNAEHIYTPDVLINKKILVEIKPKDFKKFRNDNRFELEVEASLKYCKENNLTFKLVYDTDIDFISWKYRNYLKKNHNIITNYDIKFNKEL